jgi:hypothetical protein
MGEGWEVKGGLGVARTSRFKLDSELQWRRQRWTLASNWSSLAAVLFRVSEGKSSGV